jgi:hypothetical protein
MMRKKAGHDVWYSQCFFSSSANTGKLIKSKKPHICQCIVDFNLAGKSQHDSTAKHVCMYVYIYISLRNTGYNHKQPL